MLKGWSLALGVGLAILWIAGLSATAAAPWLTWLDAVGAICAFVIAATVSDASDRNIRAGSTGALAVGLFALWIIGLSSAVPGWQAWWNFAFACASGILAIATGVSARGGFGVGQDRDRGTFQRSA